MAKNKKSRRKAASPAAAVATVGDEPKAPARDRKPAGSEEALGEGEYGRDEDTVTNGQPPRGGTAAGGPLTLYKPGQGYYTRMYTALATGVIAAFGGHYLYTNFWGDNPALQMGVPTAFLAICGILIFWVVGVNRKTNDFFIATEGEMKKVSWSTRREIIGSTKVVLVFTFFLAFTLFVVDIAFMAFFSWIDVLHIDFLQTIGWKVNG